VLASWDKASAAGDPEAGTTAAVGGLEGSRDSDTGDDFFDEHEPPVSKPMRK